MLDDNTLKMMDTLNETRGRLIDITDELDEEQIWSFDLGKLSDESDRLPKKDDDILEYYDDFANFSINLRFQYYNSVIYELLDMINPIINKIIDENKEEWEAFKFIEWKKWHQEIKGKIPTEHWEKLSYNGAKLSEQGD